MRILRLGGSEFWRNRGLNACLGLILCVGIVAQLWAAVSASISADALHRYNLDNFGTPNTYVVSADKTSSVADLIALDEFLAARRSERPELVMAASGILAVSVAIRDADQPAMVQLNAIDPAWSSISRVPIDRYLFDESPKAIVPIEWNARTPGVTGRCATIVGTRNGHPAGVDEVDQFCADRRTLRRELNEELDTGALVPAGPGLEQIGGEVNVSIYYVCPDNRSAACGDLAKLALRQIGITKPTEPLRIDKSDRLQPILRQRTADSRRNANVVAAVAAAGVGLAAAVAARGRARRYTLYRCLGATGSKVGAIAFIEAVTLTACCAALCLGAFAVIANAVPSQFSSIKGIEPRMILPTGHELTWLGAKLVALGVATGVPAALSAAFARLSIE